MAQINLIKPGSHIEDKAHLTLNIVVKFLVLCVLGLVAYYGFSYWRMSKITQEITNLKTSISSEKAKLATIKDRDELLTRQAQLLEADKLISKHTYIANLIPELASTTLKNATYTEFNTTDNGEITLSIVVPSYEDMEKFIQIFDLPEVNNKFYDLQISGINKIEEENKLAVRFEARLKYSSDILKYFPEKNTLPSAVSPPAENTAPNSINEFNR